MTVGGRSIAEIGAGLLVLVCAERGDTEAEADRLLAKILKLRIFSDEAGKMNQSLQDVGGGLLLVTGGNEVRSGAFSGQAQLAARIARKGFPVFRFDRRGVGDSDGENKGFRVTVQAKRNHVTVVSKRMDPQMKRVEGRRVTMALEDRIRSRR